MIALTACGTKPTNTDKIVILPTIVPPASTQQHSFEQPSGFTAPNEIVLSNNVIEIPMPAKPEIKIETVTGNTNDICNNIVEFVSIPGFFLTYEDGEIGIFAPFIVGDGTNMYTILLGPQGVVFGCTDENGQETYVQIPTEIGVVNRVKVDNFTTHFYMRVPSPAAGTFQYWYEITGSDIDKIQTWP
jgi:hypothetical protein